MRLWVVPSAAVYVVTPKGRSALVISAGFSSLEAEAIDEASVFWALLSVTGGFTQPERQIEPIASETTKSFLFMVCFLLSYFRFE